MALMCSPFDISHAPQAPSAMKPPNQGSFRTMQRMRTALMALGALLLLSGLVWVAQGLDLPVAPRSFMTADRSWVLIGTVVAVAGGVLIGWARAR